MRANARWLGLAVCLMALLTTCSAPRAGEGPTRISGFVAQSASAPGGLPTVQPTVTPAPGRPAQGAPLPLTATPPLAVPAQTPLAAEMAPAAPQPSPDLVARGAQMDAFVQSIAAAGGFRGAVLVARDGQVLIAKGYGAADAGAGLANSSTTRFRLASVSKPLTAVAVMQLVGEGKIDVHASICNYLSGCPAAWQPVTVRNLLNHTSGIANYTDFAAFAEIEQQPSSIDRLIGLFRDLPLGFTPGTAYQYCNSNYVLLGRIVEEVSGRPFADYMRDRIFTPLGMADSGYDSGDGAALNGTRGYAGGDVPAIALNTSNLFAAGGLYSTVEDLHRMARGLDAHVLLTPELTAQMYAPMYYSYGYGWKIEERHGRRVVYHPGYMSGAATYFGRYPDERLTVVVLSNMETSDVLGIADTLAGMALN